jgi:hypothetical protein
MSANVFFCPVMLLALSLNACTAGEARPADSSLNAESEIRTAVAEVAKTLEVVPPSQSACGASGVGAPPDEVVMVTVQQCYTCAGVGHLLRQLLRRESPDEQSLWVVVPSHESTEICRFLAREKISVPVVALQPSHFPNPKVTNDLIYVTLSDGKPVQVLWEKDGLGLLARIEEK